MEQNKTKWAIRIISVVFAVVGVAIIVALAFFWQRERAIAQELRERLSEQGAASTSGGKTPTGEMIKLCENSNARYTATVGRFTLSLDDSSYVIIKNHEGAGEGGNSSKVSIGKCLDAADKVVGFSTGEEVTLTASPSSQWIGTTFDQWVRGRLEAHGTASTELERSTIDGVSARNYRTDGLYEGRVTFFEREGLWYELEATDASSATTAAMQAREALINGFAFY